MYEIKTEDVYEDLVNKNVVSTISHKEYKECKDLLLNHKRLRHLMSRAQRKYHKQEYM